MAESFLFNTAESVLGKLTALALEEFFLARGLEDDLKGIKKMLLAIKAVIYDAEQRQSQSQSQSQGIEFWLGMLKDVLYDTEDVIDEFECEALRRQVVKSGSTTRKGLVQSSNENEELENVGLRYFQELCSRCFFQEFEIYCGNVKCKMHDLIHDLALSVTQNECLTVITGNEPLSESIRHLSFPYPQSLPQDLPTFRHLQDLDSVRTVSFLNERTMGVASEVFIETCISKFQYLRALALDFSRVAVLPKGIAKLKHLRYLSLYVNYKLQRLPESICKLQSLQTLLLGECYGLRELPKDVKYLISLRMLWITTQQRYLPNGGIGCLGSLRYLFITSCANLEYLFGDIQGLKKLRTLVIRKCNSLVSLPPSVKFLAALKTLVVADCKNLDLTMEEGIDSQDSTSQLCSLRKLEIVRLPKLVDFPQWLLPRCNTGLKVIDVSYCINFRNFPNYMHNIPSLELRITDCPQYQGQNLN